MKKSLKYFFKNILPYGIVIAIKKKFKANPKDYSCFFEKFGNSVLLSNFKIWSLHSLSKNVRIGDECMLDCTILFEALSGQVIIGNNTYIGNSTIICKSKIQFEDNILVAWGCYFYDHDSHSLNHLDRIEDINKTNIDYWNGLHLIQNKNWNTVASKPIKICSNAWIGMNVIILKGVTIGEGAIVAAGSVVTKDVAPWTLVGGNPAVFLKTLKEQ
jgi:acetyltransferase-like isoleucine patch superfamily enzyme